MRPIPLSALWPSAPAARTSFVWNRTEETSGFQETFERTRAMKEDSRTAKEESVRREEPVRQPSEQEAEKDRGADPVRDMESEIGRAHV